MKSSNVNNASQKEGRAVKSGTVYEVFDSRMHGLRTVNQQTHCL